MLFVDSHFVFTSIDGALPIDSPTVKSSTFPVITHILVNASAPLKIILLH